MHPALLISEIIHSVFSNFVIPADRATLINLACTCQAFYDIALDYLWKDIRGVTCFSRMLFPDPLNDEYDGAWRSRTERFQAVRTEREVERPVRHRLSSLMGSLFPSLSLSLAFDLLGSG